MAVACCQLRGSWKIIEHLEKQKKELEFAINRVKDYIAEARTRAEVIETDVVEWLIRAEKELGEAKSLEDEIERSMGFNWGWRSSLSKKVAKQTLNISELVETCNFRQVSLPKLELIPSKDFMASESSNSASKEIMEALNNGDVNMIGLYGMAGVGKTTLAKEVGRQAKQLFDEVVFVTVSPNADIGKIQEKIIDFLHLNLQTMNTAGTAEILWLRIKNKSILIILDDVWEELNLYDIGIPVGDDCKGCKIFLTTRLKQVCTRMNCQKEVQLNILSEDEAWALFKDIAGLKDVSPTLDDVAKEVAHECNGLPLAITMTARALRRKGLDQWIDVNQRLKDPTHFHNIWEAVFYSLELSYNFLKEDNIQSCFLLCSLFPKDYDINIELLAICGIGQGLFCDINLIEDLRREICLALSKLQQSGLLLETNDEKSVKVHNVVRKFAYWITSRRENMFMVKNGLREWPLSGSFDCYKAISLWNNEIDNFPDNLKFSKLHTLFLTGNSELKTLLLTKKQSLLVSSKFFDGMKTLRVLLLQDVVFSLEALQFLTNLRTLCFIDCELKNLSSLKNMKNLEILALLNTNIHELPEELVELRGPSNVPPNLLSRLTSLQELHVTNENNVNLLELNSVSRLTGLTLRVSTDQYFQKQCAFPKLRSDNIVVEFENMEGLTPGTLRISELFCNVKSLTLTDINMKNKNTFSFCLAQSVMHLEQLKISTYSKLDQVFAFAKEMVEQESLLPTLESILKEPTHSRLQSLKDVTIHKCDGLKSIFSPWLAQSLMHLEQLEISQCTKLEQVFAFAQEMAEQEAALLSNLTCLKLSSLPALESIWKEPTHHVSLQSLKEVIIHDCDKLKSIFSPCLAQSLLHLEKLQISDCEKLKQVFAFDKEMVELEENQVPPLSNLIYLELKSLPELSCIWRRSSHFVTLSSLKTMTIQWCIKLVYLFSPILAQTLKHLEELDIQDCNSLKHLIKEAKNSDKVVSNMDSNLLWEKLRSLTIARCKSLEYVFPITLAQGLPKLESLGVIDCPQLMHVFGMAKKKNRPEAKEMDMDEAKEMDRQDIVLPQLKDLRLENLERLRSFCPKNYFVEFPSLKDRLQ